MADRGDWCFGGFQKRRPPFSLHKICLDCRNRRGRWRGKAQWKCRDKTSGTNQPMEKLKKKKKASFSETCLCDTRSGCPEWREVVWTSHFRHLSDHVVSYSLHGLTWFCKILEHFTEAMCTEIWNSYICKCNKSSFHVLSIIYTCICTVYCNTKCNSYCSTAFTV